MNETPVTSASDILSYHGDPNLAAGSGAPVTAPQINVAPIESTIDKLQTEEIRQRQQKHAEDLQDQADRAKFISSLTNSGNSIFNMKGPDGTNHSYSLLPQDEKILNDQTVDIIHDINNNPDGFEYDEKIQKKMMERNRLLNYAQMRSMHDANNRLQAASAIDPEDKQGYLQNSKENIDDNPLTSYKPLVPYSPGPAISSDDFMKKGADDQKNWQLMKDDGVNETYVVPSNLMVDPRTLTPGDPLYYKAIKWADRFLKSPQAHDPQVAQGLNTAANNFNTARDLKPGDPGYIPPPFNIDPKTGELSFTEKDPNKLPFEITAALNAEKHGQPIVSAKSAEDRAKLANEQARTNKEKADLDKISSDIEKNNAEIEEKKAQAAKLQGEAKGKAEKEQQEIEEVNAPVSKYLSVVKDARSKKFVPVPPNVAPALSTQGIDPTKYDVALLTPSDEGIKNIAAIEGKDMKGAPTGRNIAPAGAYYMKSKSGNPKDDFIAVNYKEGTADQWKVIKPNEAIGNIIHSEKGKNITDKTIETISKSQNKLNEYLSGGGQAQQNPAQAQGDEAAVRARLVPAKVKTKDGKEIDIMYDPVTKKRYATQ